MEGVLVEIELPGGKNIYIYIYMFIYTYILSWLENSIVFSVFEIDIIAQCSVRVVVQSRKLGFQIFQLSQYLELSLCT